MIAREQKVIAVVDHHVEHGIVVGAATPPGLTGGLVHHHAGSRRGEAYRGGEPGKSRTDHVNRARHQMKA